MRSWSCMIASVIATSVGAQAPGVGSTLPRWTPGTLDIHQISTGRGNSALIVMPDGTTMLVDAGAAGDGIAETDPHPDASRAPGDWIARYVKRQLPSSAAGLDYALITHFHADHFGQLLATSTASPKGNYKQFGITQVGDAIPIRMLIDRGWPDYQYPVPFTDSSMAHYRRFLDAQRQSGMTVARFQPGSGKMIYSGVGNIVGVIAANGELRRMVSMPGTAGHNARKIQAFEYPFTAGLVLHHRLSPSFELSGKAALALVLLTLRGENVSPGETSTRLDPGAHLSTELRGPPFGHGLLPFVGVHAELFPRSYVLDVVPVGQVGVTNRFWLGATAGLSFDLAPGE